MIRLIALLSGLALGLQFRSRQEDPIIQPIQVEPITVDDNTMFGDSDSTTTTPSPYMTNPPSIYTIEPVLQPTLGESELKVNVTSDDLDLCKKLTGQVRIDAGCLGRK